MCILGKLKQHLIYLTEILLLEAEEAVLIFVVFVPTFNIPSMRRVIENRRVQRHSYWRIEERINALSREKNFTCKAGDLVSTAFYNSFQLMKTNYGHISLTPVLCL